MATQIATLPTAEETTFGLMQRQAAMFAASPLIPEHLRKGDRNTAIANCYIALRLAQTMGEDPMVVMQNIHVVSGRAGFSAQYMIARANASGVFTDCIDWNLVGSGKDLEVTAFATLKSTGRKVEVKVGMAMAEAEGWTRNSKYKTMPEIMLRYRAATFLVRFYAPQVMLGYQTAEEVIDAHTPAAMEVQQPLTASMLIEQSQAPVEVVDQETGEITQAENANDGHGEAVTLQSAIDEINSAENVISVNQRLAALRQHLNDDDADTLMQIAGERIDCLKG